MYARTQPASRAPFDRQPPTSRPGLWTVPRAHDFPLRLLHVASQPLWASGILPLPCPIFMIRLRRAFRLGGLCLSLPQSSPRASFDSDPSNPRLGRWTARRPCDFPVTFCMSPPTTLGPWLLTFALPGLYDSACASRLDWLCLSLSLCLFFWFDFL